MSVPDHDRSIVFVDADNTLWDTDRVYATAQLQLLKRVEDATKHSAPQDQLKFVRSIDQAIASNHHLGLKYPPRLLIYAVSRVLAGIPPEKAVRTTLRSVDSAAPLDIKSVALIEEEFTQNLRSLPAILPGVQRGLEQLRESGLAAFVLTEGSRPRVLATIERHNLSHLLPRVIDAPKHERLYLRALRLARAAHGFMIGDQLRQDIIPAITAGLTTIFLPSLFRPSWEPDIELVRPDFTVSRFDEAAEIILAYVRRLNA